jgi:hypothetical protein
MGKQVMNVRGRSDDGIDIRTLTKGIYILEATTEDKKIITQKFIKE